MAIFLFVFFLSAVLGVVFDLGIGPDRPLTRKPTRACKVLEQPGPRVTVRSVGRPGLETSEDAPALPIWLP
jgi:hypothetical protein